MPDPRQYEGTVRKLGIIVRQTTASVGIHALGAAGFRGQRPAACRCGCIISCDRYEVLSSPRHDKKRKGQTFLLHVAMRTSKWLLYSATKIQSHTSLRGQHVVRDKCVLLNMSSIAMSILGS